MDNPTDVVSLLQGGGFDYQTYPVGRVTRVSIQPILNGGGYCNTEPTIPGTVFTLIMWLVALVLGMSVAITALIVFISAVGSIDVSLLPTYWADIIVGSWAGSILVIWALIARANIQDLLSFRFQHKKDLRSMQEYHKQLEAQEGYYPINDAADKVHKEFLRQVGA